MRPKRKTMTVNTIYLANDKIPLYKAAAERADITFGEWARRAMDKALARDLAALPKDDKEK
jgi:hypothetical protein